MTLPLNDSVCIESRFFACRTRHPTWEEKHFGQKLIVPKKLQFFYAVTSYSQLKWHKPVSCQMCSGVDWNSHSRIHLTSTDTDSDLHFSEITPTFYKLEAKKERHFLH